MELTLAAEPEQQRQQEAAQRIATGRRRCSTFFFFFFFLQLPGSRQPELPRHAAQVDRQRRPARDRLVVDARVGRDDHGEVGALERLVQRRRCGARARARSRDERVVVGDLGAAVAHEQSMIFSAGDSRMSLVPAL